MNLLRRLLGILVVLLSTACLIGCVAAIVGIWIAHQDLSQKTRTIFSRLEIGLERASNANWKVGRALEKARADVAWDEKKRDKFEKRETVRPPDAARRLVWQEIGPRLNELRGRLAISADAAVVVHSFLQSLQELPLGQTGRIDPERLERLTDRSAQLSASVQKLQTMVGDEEKEIADGVREVDHVLRNCQTVVDEWQSDLDSARSELPYIEAEFLGWMTFMAVGATVAFAWVALSQISLFAHALTWCRGQVTDRANS